MHNDSQLIESAQQGDRDALGELLLKYESRIYNVCLRMLGNSDDAREITQDAFVKIVQHIKSYDGRASISTWMIRIAMNLSISWIRKRKIRKAQSLETPISRENEDSADLKSQLTDETELSPDSNVQKSEMIDHMQHCLSRLDEDFRSILVLRDLNGMNYADISQTLELPVGTVKSRLFRARLALRNHMEETQLPSEWKANKI